IDCIIRGDNIRKKQIFLILIIIVMLILFFIPWDNSHETLRRYLMLALALLTPLYFLATSKKDEDK
ncbi:hypothetical protein, partial [Bacillus pumilus]